MNDSRQPDEIMMRSFLPALVVGLLPFSFAASDRMAAAANVPTQFDAQQTVSRAQVTIPDPHKTLANPLTGKPLRYRIGTDAHVDGNDGEIIEVSYSSTLKPRHGIAIKYCNLFDENNTGAYGPYLHTSDTAAEYSEGQIDPRGAGWLKNLHEQFGRAKRQGFDYIELDNPDAYSVGEVVGAVDEAARYGLKVIAKNPSLMQQDPLPYVAHTNIHGIIVEKGAGSAHELDSLRRAAGAAKLPVWFVFFGKDGAEPARHAAAQIKAAGYPNMSVTWDSAREEYGGDIQDVLLPIERR
jgi:hypothetical protein